jgi:hypothetical protein
MSRYVVYYSVRKEMYREMAERWKRWSSTMNLTEAETYGVSLFFYQIARRFGLISEFRELGVII